MKQPSLDSDKIISLMGRKAAAKELGCATTDLDIVGVDGGYSRNRRSLVEYGARRIFVKEVDPTLLPSDGAEELEWLRKDYECAAALRRVAPKLVPDWSKLTAGGHVLLMSSYRAEDGWLWSLPLNSGEQQSYIQTVIDATKQLESIEFDQADVDKLKLQPYFRDKLALDDGFDLITQNETVRSQLEDKYEAMASDESPAHIHRSINKMQKLLRDKKALADLSSRAGQLIDQPNDCFGHCDVRSDNIAYNPSTGQIKFVDWNWASFATKGFGATEFLIDMARAGVDVMPWRGEFNAELLAALVGFYAKRCLEDPLAPGNTLRDVQAQSAAVALDLYNTAVGL